MVKLGRGRAATHTGIAYAATGISGFDVITGGGLPAGRTTVVLGGAGGGKTIFGAQILANGAQIYKEPGIFVSFEESADQIFQDLACFRWGLRQSRPTGIQLIDARLPQSVVHGGEFDLLGLLAILEHKVKTSGARRILLDGVDVLLDSLGDATLARREVFRLHEWLQDQRLTSILTAKASGADIRLSPEYDFLQFMADCMIKIDHRLVDGTALRFLRVAKCRGSAHSANEFPLTIGESGIEIGGSHPEIHHTAPTKRVSTGIDRLDTMVGGGYHVGSSTLISGAPGTAKTTLGAAFAAAASQRKERTLLVSFDEAPLQIVRNMQSVGIYLGEHVRSGVLRMHSLRGRAASPEGHAAQIRELIRKHQARNLVVDPISNLGSGVMETVAREAAVAVLDDAKSLGLTSVYTSLPGDRLALAEGTPIGISTIADTWIHLTYVNHGGERNRALAVIKSRGTGHSNQVRELLLSRRGVTLADVYTAGGEVLTGTLRWERENEVRHQREAAIRDAEARKRSAELALAEADARVVAARSAHAAQQAELERANAAREEVLRVHDAETGALRRRRGADEAGGRPKASTRVRK
jgi:circadian clock protein KaiC